MFRFTKSPCRCRKSIIQAHQLIGSAAQANFLRVFQGMQAVPGLDAVYEGLTVLRRIYQVDASLVQRHRVDGGQDTDVVHIRFSGVSIAVAVHAQTVHDVDVDILEASVECVGRKIRYGQHLPERGASPS